MAKFVISGTEWWYVRRVIEAETEEEARELFLEGEGRETEREFDSTDEGSLADVTSAFQGEADEEEEEE